MEEIILEEYVDKYYDIIRKNIKKCRKDKHFTQQQLADKIGYSEDYIREIESPTKNKRFSLRIVILIAMCLDVSLDNFFK